MDSSKELCRFLGETTNFKDLGILRTCQSMVEATPWIEIDTELGDASWSALMYVLRIANVSRVEHLAFSLNFNETIILDLANVLESGRFSALQSLHLFSSGSGFHLGRRGSRALSMALLNGNLRNLQSLVLPDCRFSDILLEGVLPGGLCLLNVLSVNPSKIPSLDVLSVTASKVPLLDPGAPSRSLEFRRPYRYLEDEFGVEDTFYGKNEKTTFPNLRHLELQNETLSIDGGLQLWLSKSLRQSPLTYLRLSGGPLTFGDLNLLFGDLNLRSLGRAVWFKTLRNLHLDFCGMTSPQFLSLSRGIHQTKADLELELLNLQNNKLNDDAITALVGLGEKGLLPQLKELDLSRNDIESAHALTNLLNAIQNGRFPRLQKLDWRGNAVDDMAAKFLLRAYMDNKTFLVNTKIDWSQVNDLSLRAKAKEFRDRNVLLCQLKEELKEGLNDGLNDGLNSDLLRELEEELKEVPVTTAKVFLCGYSGVGKTTLRESLKRYMGLRTKFYWERRPRFELPWLGRRPSTRGIELCKIESKGKKGESLALVLWDLAGQEEFHVMHGAFFPDLGLAGGKATTFLIVLRAEFSKRTKAELLYWLRFVASSSMKEMKRHVIIVLNRFQSEPCPDTDLKLLRALIEEFVTMFYDLLDIRPDPFLIDARVASEVKELKEHLFHQAGTSLESVQVPRLCLTLQRKLKEWSEGGENHHFPILSWDSFESLLKMETVGYLTDTALKAAVRYLHEFGEIVYFGEEAFNEPGLKKASLLVPDPEWFCREVVGQLLLPEDMLEKGERSVNEILSADGSILVFQFQAHFQHLLAQNTRAEDVISMLVRLGLCYRMGTKKILVPALIQKDDLRLVDWEGRGVNWVLGRSLTTEDEERTTFPMTLFRRLQVEIAQDRRFGGRGDSEYRVGKSYSSFKVGALLVLVQFDVDPSDPTDDRVDILVKNLIQEDPDLKRIEQIECICSIMHEVERLCVQCCPGVKYDRKVIKPWSATDETCSMSRRELMSVREIKSRIQEHGMENYTAWQVHGKQVKEKALLSLSELEEVRATAGRVYAAQEQCAVSLGLFTEHSLPALEAAKYSTPPPSLVPDGMSFGCENNGVITRGFIREELSKVIQTVQREGQLTRQHLDKWSRELDKSLSDIRQKQNLLVKHVQALQKFSIEEKEQCVPRFMFLSKLKEDKSSVWITLKEAFQRVSDFFQSSFQLHLLCECRYENGLIHEVEDQEGIEINKPKEWLVKISPWLRWSLQVANVVAKIAGVAVMPGLGLLFSNFPSMEGTTLAKAVDTAATVLDEQLAKVKAAPGLEGNQSSAKQPINMKERMIAEAVLGDLMREMGHAAFVEKIGLRKVVLNQTVPLQVQSSHQEPQSSVLWICNACFVRYGAKVTDITQRT